MNKCIKDLMVDGYEIVGKRTKVRIIAACQDGEFIFQVYKKKMALLYQGSEENRVYEIFVKNEGK